LGRSGIGTSGELHAGQGRDEIDGEVVGAGRKGRSTAATGQHLAEGSSLVGDLPRTDDRAAVAADGIAGIEAQARARSQLARVAAGRMAGIGRTRTMRGWRGRRDGLVEEGP
jgi:hypothetical protein